MTPRMSVIAAAIRSLGGGVGSGVNPAGYRYYRIYITTNNSDTYTALGEIELRGTVGGADLTTPSTTSFQSTYYTPNASTAAKAINDAIGAGPNAWMSDGTALPQWISFDFGVTTFISEVAMWCEWYSGGPARAPKDFLIQGSTDNSTWVTINGYSGVTGWGFSSTTTDVKTFAVTLNPLTLGDDPYTSYVKLLMHMDPSSSMDSYTKLLLTMQTTGLTDACGHTMTVNSGISRSSTQSKFGGYSGFFNGSANGLTTPHASDLDLSSGDFTIEAWVYPISNSYDQCVVQKDIDLGTLGSTNESYNLYISSTGQVCGRVGSGNSLTYQQTVSSAASVVPFSAWTHVAFTRIGTTLSVFAAGVLVGTATQTGTPVDGGHPVMVGLRWNSGFHDSFFNGYIDELRITKGLGRYSATFTPPGSLDPLLLVDDLGHAVTAVGNAALSSTQSKFGGNSLYLGGAGDYLTTPHNTEFSLGSGDLTCEFWVCPDSSSLTGVHDLVNKSGKYSVSVSNWGVYLNGGKVEFLGGQTGAPGTIQGYVTGSTTLSASTWYHVACVKLGTLYSIYLNGVLDASTTVVGVPSDSVAGALYIGWQDSQPSQYFSGYLDELRITSGVARYTSNFQVQNCRFGGDPQAAKVSLLMPFNTGLLDMAGHVVSAHATPTLSSTQSKFGGNSCFFGSNDSNGNYFSIPYSPDFDFGTGDFTVEFWIYQQGRSTLWGTFIYDGWNGGGAGPTVGIDTSGHLEWFGGATSGVVPLNAWTHIAICRQGTTSMRFINGVLDWSGSDSTNYYVDPTGEVRIGMSYNGASTTQINGYLDDLRVTKGFCRYTANFTPVENIPLANDPFWSSNVMVLRMDGLDNGTSFIDAKGHTFTAVGNAKTKVAQHKFGTTAAYFDGAGDYISTPDSVDWQFPGDFTVECWVWIDSGTNAIQAIYNQRASNGTQFNISYSGGNYYQWAWCDGGAIVTQNTGIILNPSSWVHLVWQRLGTNFRTYVNGNLNHSVTWSGVPADQTVVATIGGDAAGYGQDFKGYIDDFRITKGVARYLNNFSPVGVPLPIF